MADIRPGRRKPPSRMPIVLKVGSSSLTLPDGGIDDDAILRVTEQVGTLWDAGFPTVLVSSGAVAAGSAVLGRRPRDTTGLQVAAAVGQTLLMARYNRAFGALGLTVGQVLITLDILSMRSQYLHARGALQRMLENSIVPIVNENDTVAVEELKMGDNDRVAAIVSHLVGAGMLVILTDTDGLYSADPRSGEGEPISVIRHSDPLLDRLAPGTAGPIGSGGVGTKIEAARMAAWSGIPTVIARSDRTGVIDTIIRGGETGTYVAPGDTKLSAWKLWLAFGQQPSGTLRIDDGAVRALARRGGSLLPVGVTGVDGEFPAEASVEVRSRTGVLVGKGLVTSDSDQVRERMGKRSTDTGIPSEVIHRDRLVVLLDG
ncbi:MAG: glutamate 5-kinase [bacterium]|nr:glutamate 5-kinase [bacterium]MDE0290086.1 glutamate 5-kinase [bacterium]MDE0437293.1 glutamate 5-kinase [bacterium]